MGPIRGRPDSDPLFELALEQVVLHARQCTCCGVHCGAPECQCQKEALRLESGLEE